MAKPRIFVSSTYYDLKHIRTSLESFINSFGYEPVLFESGDIFFSHEKPLDESCYNELKNCHMQILIIGGSYGSAESGSKLSEEDKKDPYKVFNSVTKKEFEVALGRKIPIYFFVENGVLAEYNTYKKNRNNKGINYAHVSSVNIFTLLDDIYALHNGNFIKGFTKFEDISDWLKSQWAHLMAEFISRKTEQIELVKIKNSVDELNNVTNSLKAYTEAFLNVSNPTEFAKIKTEQDIKENIRIRKRFDADSFINYVSKQSGHDSDKLFEDFNSSKNVEDFLIKIIPLGIKSKYFVGKEHMAEEDFNLLKSLVDKSIDLDDFMNIKEDMKPVRRVRRAEAKSKNESPT